MTLYTQFATSLEPDTISSITNGNGLLDVHTVSRALSAPSGARARIYAYLERGECAGQIVRLSSIYYLEQYETLIGFAWSSSTTLADLIRPAN